MTSLNVRRILVGSLAALLAGSVLPVLASKSTAADNQLSHAVFFALKDRSPEARDKFIASCEKYLTGHTGSVSFAVGSMAEDVVEPGVSDRDFDVALLVVFENKAARDSYLKAPRHDQFVAENKAGFAKVRVFDSYLTPRK